MKYEIEILSVGNDKTKILRAFRTIGRMSLQRANKLHLFAMETERLTLVAGIDKDAAEHVETTLTRAGAIARVKESVIKTPMVCDPQANNRYRWGALRILSAAD